MATLPANRVSGWQIVAAVLAIGLVANAAIGILPFAPIEGDEQALINGLRETVRGSSGLAGLGYTYELQPGTHEIILGLHWLTQADVATLYFVTSAACAAMFGLLSALLGSRLLGVPLVWCVVATALSQEIVSAATYANSSTLGGFFVVAALVILESRAGRTGWLLAAGAFIALGGWCRFDALALAPLAFVILVRKQSVRNAIGPTCLLALVSAGGLLVLLSTSGVTLHAIWQVFQAKTDLLGPARTFASLYLLHSATGLVLALAGVTWAIVRREYWLPAAVAIVFVPLFLIHGRSLDSTKYFYYGVPVLTWSAVWLVARLWARARESPHPSAFTRRSIPRALILATMIAIGLEYFTSVRRIDNPRWRWGSAGNVQLLTFSGLHHSPMEWILGAGDAVPSGDAFRVRFGYGFSPWLWHLQKHAVLCEYSRFDDLLAHTERATVISSTYLSHVVAVAILRGQSFQPGTITHPNPGNSTTTSRLWHKDHRTIELLLINHTAYRFAEFRQSIEHPTAPRLYFVNDLGRNFAESLMASDADRWTLLSPDPNGALVLYQRQ